MFFSGLEEFSARAFQQLTVLNPRRTYRLARATAETAIDMIFKRGRIDGQAPFFDRAHQVDAPARTVILIAGSNISGAGFETQATVNAGEQLLLVLRKRGC